MSRSRALGLAAGVLVVATGAPAVAHTTSTGLAAVTVSGATVTYRLTLLLAELPEEPARMLDAAAQGDAPSAGRVAAALREKVRVQADGAVCEPGRVRLQGSRLGDSRVDLEVVLRCPRAPARLAIRDDWADLFGSHYRTLARIDTGGRVRELAFLPDARDAHVDLGGAAAPLPSGFFRLGVEHILTGYDHLLFLSALLLGGGGAFALLKIVTAFTVAHSVTLALAALGLVTVPGRVVEPVIAASIAWVAVENVWLRRGLSRRWLVSFAFGLVHGFGFASALKPLALPARNLAVALVGFNLGVEAGQAAVVALALPLLLWQRRRASEPRLARALSVAIALVGLVWLLQRLFFV